MINYQIHFSPGDAAAHRDDLTEAIRTIVTDGETYEEVETAAEADYTLLVSRPHGRGWLGVYEQRTEPTTLTDLESTAGALSEAFDRPVVAARLDEQDTLELRLVRRGEMADRYSSNPTPPSSTHGGLTADQLAGTPQRWAELVAPDHDADELADAWRTDDPFGPDILGQTAEILGQDPVLAGMGASSLKAVASEGVTALHFRRRQQATDLERVGGMPQFAPPDAGRLREASVGDQMQVSASVGNRGGRADGVRVLLSGPAITRGLLEVDSIRIMGGRAGDQQEAAGRRIDGPDGQPLVVADFPDRVVEGALAGEVDLSEMSESRQKRLMDAHRATRLTLYASVRATDEGSGDLEFGLQAIDRPETRATSTTPMSIGPTPRRPLHVDPEVVQPHELRRLQKSNTLFALLHFGAPVDTWREAAVEAVGTWSGAIARPGDVFTTVTAPAPATRPNESTLPAADLAEANRRDQLADELADLHQFSALLDPTDPPDEPHRAPRTAGFSFFSGAGDHHGDDPAAAPALGFWVELSDRQPDEINRLDDRLTDIVDRLARSAPLVQGIMDRWDWAPDLRPDNMPYESACGLLGDDHLEQDWLTGHLRAATRVGWLTADHLDRLDRDELAAIADLESLEGDIWRLTLDDRADLDALERLLAPLLPGRRR